MTECKASTSTSSAALAACDDKNSVFLCCDIQEVFRDKIYRMPGVIAGAVFLNKSASAMAIPVIATEQKPFLKTVAEIDLKAVGAKCWPKTKFSMCIDEVVATLEGIPERNHVFLYGIEAHVCVLQTALDLLRKNYVVHIVVDAVSSQNATDREVALERMKQAGCIFTTAESAVYEIMKDAKHAKFKDVLVHVKEFAQTRSGATAKL